MRTIKPAYWRASCADGAAGHRQVRHQPGCGQGRRLPDHHPHDPDMGWHFLNPAIQGFDVTKPADPGLRAPRPQLAAGRPGMGLPRHTGHPPCRGRPTGRSPPPATTATAPSCSPGSRSCAPAQPPDWRAFNFWHPDLVTLHVWLWYPNPAGLYTGTNPLVRPSTAASHPSATLAGTRARTSSGSGLDDGQPSRPSTGRHWCGTVGLITVRRSLGHPIALRHAIHSE